MRTASCLGLQMHVIEPCGFVLSDKHLRRAGMDYVDALDMTRHVSWAAFCRDHTAVETPGRLVLLTTKGAEPLQHFQFRHGDTLLLGRESAGVPDEVHSAADSRVVLPMVPGARSMNVAVAGAVAAFEALRQLQALPGSATMPPQETSGELK